MLERWSLSYYHTASILSFFSGSRKYRITKNIIFPRLECRYYCDEGYDASSQQEYYYCVSSFLCCER